MKYYFITYQATNKQGSISAWNEVIDISPMKFIKHIAKVEYEGGRTYSDFLIINAIEISEAEYNEFKGYF